MAVQVNIHFTAKTGMACPKCRRRSAVIDTREPMHGGFVRRRRECVCGHRFTTRERIEPQLEPQTDYQI